MLDSVSEGTATAAVMAKLAVAPVPRSVLMTAHIISGALALTAGKPASFGLMLMVSRPPVLSVHTQLFAPWNS